MRDSSIISLSSEFLMSRDNKRVIPLRIFFNLEQPTKPRNEICSYEILDGIAANSVNPQVLPPLFFSILFFITNSLSISPSYSYNDLNALPSQIADVNLFRINWIEAIPSSLAGIGISTRSGSQSVSTKQIVGIPKVLHSPRAMDSSR
jgi:hypothetical protein